MHEISGVPILVIPSTKRKRSIGFRVTSNGLEVRIPVHYNQKLLTPLLEKRKSWILRSWEKMQKKEIGSIQNYENGSLFPFVGKVLFLKISENSEKNYCISDGETLHLFLKHGNESKKISLIETWYKKEATHYLAERTKTLAQLHNFHQLEGIVIKSYKAKYGMCKGKDIYLDYKIVKMSPNIIDHIIFHELTHLIHKHHQLSFRNKLSTLDPNWKKHKMILKGKIDE